jgi:hypothetical protein
VDGDAAAALCDGVVDDAGAGSGADPGGVAGTGGARLRKLFADAVWLVRRPDPVAASLSEAVEAIRPRGRAIARTELLRVYRTVMIRKDQANGDILIGWEWLAALQPSTCPVCLAVAPPSCGYGLPSLSTTPT